MITIIIIKGATYLYGAMLVGAVPFGAGMVEAGNAISLFGSGIEAGLKVVGLLLLVE